MHTLPACVGLDAMDKCVELYRVLVAAAAMHVFAALQAKPFINEAHVFNDAGLSFDVWPPRTGTPASDAPPKPTAIDLADGFSSLPDQSSDEEDTLHPVENTCLAGSDIDAAGGLSSSGNGNGVGMAAASDVVGGDMGISRGYLLAVKLWEEAIATVNPVHSTERLGA